MQPGRIRQPSSITLKRGAYVVAAYDSHWFWYFGLVMENDIETGNVEINVMSHKREKVCGVIIPITNITNIGDSVSVTISACLLGGPGSIPRWRLFWYPSSPRRCFYGNKKAKDLILSNLHLVSYWHRHGFSDFAWHDKQRNLNLERNLNYIDEAHTSVETRRYLLTKHCK